MKKISIIFFVILTLTTASFSIAQTIDNAKDYWKEVEIVYKQWMNAWVNKDINNYLSAYSPHYEPLDGRDHVSWRQDRYSRLKKPGKITINVDDLRVISLKQNELLVTFQQRYKSQGYQDTVIKQVLFKKIKGHWKIVSEVQLGA